MTVANWMKRTTEKESRTFSFAC